MDESNNKEAGKTIVNSFQFSNPADKIAANLVRAQKAFKPPFKNRFNKFFKNSYADINQMITSVRPVLNENEMTLMFSSGLESRILTVNCLILHKSGQYLSASVMMGIGVTIKDQKETPLLDSENPITQTANISKLTRFALGFIFANNPVDEEEGKKALAQSENGGSNKNGSIIIDKLISLTAGKNAQAYNEKIKPTYGTTIDAIIKKTEYTSDELDRIIPKWVRFIEKEYEKK